MPSSPPHLPNPPFAITPRLAVSTVRQERRLVWLVGLSHATNHFVMLIFPAVLLLVQQEFDLGYAVLGFFANVALLAYGMGALPAGILADRLGGTRILAIWLLGGSLACIGIGMSAGPVNLVIGLAALGLFGSLPFQGFSTFLPAYLSERAQIPGLSAARVARGGSIASLALLFGGLGHLLAGRLMATRWRVAVFLIGMVGTALALFGMGATAGLPLVLFSILLSVGHFSLGTISNTFIAFHTPPHLGGTAFGITFTLALGVGSVASSAMGLVGQRFGLPAVFLSLGMVTAGAVVLVYWFGRVVGAWSRISNGKRATDPPSAEQRSISPRASI